MTEHKKIGVVGLGYVGLPLALTFVEAGQRVLGFDVDASKPEKLLRGETYLKHLPAERIAAAVATGRFDATTDLARVQEVDALIYCVPTPLTRHREPDLSFIRTTCKQTAPHIQKGTVVVLESTTYPGTTDEVVRPILEEGSGLKADRDFFLAFSPEREDPGNERFATKEIPKIVGADSAEAQSRAVALYAPAFDRVVSVSSTRAAELIKLFENTFRSVNIALVNELKILCHRMNLDVFEVIGGAATKPFGFMPFYPGPGLGGHCIPIDPFYLTWKAREYGLPTRFIELAGEINTAMPRYVVYRAMLALNERGKAFKGTRILILGAAYKKDVDDMRESPALEVMALLRDHGAEVDYHDPYVPVLPATRRYKFEMRSVPLDEARLKTYDLAFVITDHDGVDYDLIARTVPLVIDSRNVYKTRRPNVIPA